MQQLEPSDTVSQLIAKYHVLEDLKALGTTIRFSRKFETDKHSLSLLVLSDAVRQSEKGLLFYIVGLLVE